MFLLDKNAILSLKLLKKFKFSAVKVTFTINVAAFLS
jgi:hypothetical protein